jgi:undecaprenyl-diphosphatase
MFDIIKAVLFGVVQGITEFLPVSSSGHLLILHDFFDLPIQNELAFDVVLHLASLLAVLLFFRKDILELINAFVDSLRGKKSDLSRTCWMIIVATIPAALAGVFLEDIIENQLRSILIVALMLVVVAVLFIIIENRKNKNNNGSYNNLSLAKAAKIGFAQALALIPGTSRSGITIIAGISLGLKRDEAIKFSFLLSIPIILGASATKIPSFLSDGFIDGQITILISAFFASFFSAFLTIKYFLKFAKNHTLIPFAYYRIFLAVLLVAFWYLGK